MGILAPQVARLTVVGQSVVRQFGLRAIVNLVTAAGITLVLLLFGVDFPLLWGVLTFFLSYVPYIGLRKNLAKSDRLRAIQDGHAK